MQENVPKFKASLTFPGLPGYSELHIKSLHDTLPSQPPKISQEGRHTTFLELCHSLPPKPAGKANWL